MLDEDEPRRRKAKVTPRNVEFRRLFLFRRERGNNLLLRRGLAPFFTPIIFQLVTSVSPQLSRHFRRAAVATTTSIASTKV
jgi:hypothetical protein